MRFVGRLTKNLGWKFLSLALAVLLWMAIVGEPELATSVSAPVLFRNIPADLEIGSDVPNRIHLEVRGPSGKLRAATLADLVVVLDLAAVRRSGERTFTVQPQHINLPRGVLLSRAVPSQIRARFESSVAREVPIRTRYSAQVPAGYRIAQQQVDPAMARIVGPESRVTRVEAVQTDPIDLSGVVGESWFEVQLYVADPQVRLAASPTARVKVVLERVP
jgi:hypothetical protein